MDTPIRLHHSLARNDGRPKACGAERYAADRYPDPYLWAGALRSGIPCGRILSVDTREAADLPGVFRILTASDVPGTNRQGIVHKDMPVLCEDVVRYCGDPIALVLAEDKAALQQALSRIRFEIEPLPAVCSLDEAMAQGAPLVHADRPDNVLAHALIETGDSAAAFERSDIVVEGSFSTPVQAHAFLETECGVARLEEDGGLFMEVSTQSPFRDRFEIAHALGLSYQNIRIVSPPLGGGFGGKDGATVQCLLGLAALNAGGRWVRMQWDREESFRAGYKRHACRMNYRLGATSDGELVALDARLWYDTGAYAHLGAEVMELGMEHAGGPYRIPNTRIEGWCVYTNEPVAGAMRAFGVCQATFGIESMMDMLAQRLRIDPLSLRIRNALHRGERNCAGVRLETSTGIQPCLETIQAHPLWKTRDEWKRQAPRFRKRGVGVVAVWNAAGYGGGVRDAAIAKIELCDDGTFLVHNAVSDMGQGNSCAFFQIAGHILNQDTSRIAVKQPDTRSAYPSGSSSAGRTTYTYGKALITACERMKARLINRAGLVLFLQDDDGIEMEPGRIVHRPSGREVSLQTLARMMQPEERVILSESLAPTCKDVPKTAKGFFIGFPHVIFGYGAHLVRLEIDERTGEAAIIDYLAVTDGGRVLNPAMFEQQIQGGVAQGLGYALMEDFRTRQGHVITEDFTTYLIPASLDTPDIASIAIEADEEESGPFGMKGIGEVAMNGPLPAVANAVADASGRRICEGPITAERILGLT
ncbi:xanthine dehydrogenase family protein molybdopterin-binding subunit [Desulfatirhabdium butyrativorans]|uniref:xanthine dehydrogenase family protein molybdopterin-binding subunit n=1 Tax=Desulfatirhabdium butyrativorans TaxID=340467 RepID=UPI0004842EE2|nr:xanthine dehydrogenase family protein molybdopterin-binding subunit [Desulfatirhabdium butyrativorans]